MKTGWIGLVLAFAGAPLLRRWHMRWGASQDETTRPLPGDDIVPNAIISTRAIQINAPASAIWPWLVQMGQDRAGFYSYDLLERLAGARIHNSDQIVPEWQRLSRGDLMRTYRYIQRFEPLGWTVETVETDRALVVCNKKKTWSWALVLDTMGSGKTRLVARTRSARQGLVGSMAERLVAEPMHFVMEVGFLRGVKHRAEAASASREPTLIDALMPDAEFSDTISLTVNASAAAIFDAAMQVTANDMPIAKVIGTLRYLPGRIAGREAPASDGARPFIPMLLNSGTVLLQEQPACEMVFGSAGKYHQLTDQEPRPFQTVQDYQTFNDPEYQQLVMSLRVEPTGTPRLNRLVLEHRTHPLGEESRRKFRRYWRVIKPSGAFVSRQLLWAIKSRAERTGAV